jgi:DNA replication protein DnaC
MDPVALDRIGSYLKTLKLFHMERALGREIARAQQEGAGGLVAFERLLELEVNTLIERRCERRIRESKLPDRKLLADFDFDFQTGIRKEQIMELASLSFVEQKQGLILAGSSGSGKSHIAKALLLIGCQKLYSCRYTRASDMIKDLMAGLSDDSVQQKLKAYVNCDILLIDEVGFDRLEQESARNAALFFKVIEGRYCRNTTILTTNIDFKALGDYLGDPVITTALVDRMVHHSIIISIEGPSYRMYESQKLNRSAGSRSRKK